MKKPDKAAGASVNAPDAIDAGFRKKYPTLLAYLSDETWDDGTDRETSTITIRVDGGLLQVSVNDRALRQSVYCTSQGLHEALGLLEEALVKGTVTWRPWSGGKGKKKG